MTGIACSPASGLSVDGDTTVTAIAVLYVTVAILFAWWIARVDGPFDVTDRWWVRVPAIFGLATLWPLVLLVSVCPWLDRGWSK